MALAIAMSFAACAKKTAPADASDASAPAVTTSDNKAGDSKGDVKVEYSIDGEFLVFKIDCKVLIETDAWVGICKKGNYIYEDDADDAEFAYSYYEDRESDSEPYCFKVAYTDLDDGNYSVVFCNTDNTGYVIASWTLVLKNAKPTIDYSDFKVNQKPANINGTESPAATVEDEEDDPNFDEDSPDADSGDNAVDPEEGNDQGGDIDPDNDTLDDDE